MIPGFRTGCKVAVLDKTGKYLEYTPVFPHTGAEKKEKAKTIVLSLLKKHNIELIAIGNGTAGRETDQFISEILTDLEVKPVKVLVTKQVLLCILPALLLLKSFLNWT